MQQRFLNTQIEQKIIKNFSTYHLKVLLLACFAIIFTFPVVELNFGAGIDDSLIWAFNFLAHGHLQLGKNIIFPHGPLAFTMYPLKENFFIYLFAKTILQFILVFQLFNLTVRDNEKHESWLLAILFSILLLKICSFNLLIIASISALYLNSYNTESKQKKYVAFAITAIAFYIKSYVAIISGIIAFCFIVYEYVKKRKAVETIKDIIIIWSLIILLWILMYHRFSGFFRYIYGMYNLAQDNSSAAAYYPENNWWMLAGFIISLLCIPFFNNAKRVKYFIALLALSIFAGWKHGMAREDSSHTSGFFYLLLCFAILFIVFTKKNAIRNFALISFALICFIINLTNVYSYSPLTLELTGVNNFVSLIRNYSAIKYQADELTKNILPDSVKHIIGNEKVDVYPWDYSIIPANQLNWQPRPIIQSYAAYTSWLDKENAAHFESSNAASFLIWQLDKVSLDVLTGCFESIDGRYLLNDEPNALISILRNYEPVYKDNKYIVYKKRANVLPFHEKSIAKAQTSWNKWEATPNVNADLIRLKVKFHGNILQKIKSFLYKDEFFYIYCKMEDSSIVKWRIVPKNAEDGLWINPMIFDPSNNIKPRRVVSVLFKNSNPKLLKDKIELEWMQYQFDNAAKANYPVSFFYQDSLIQYKTIYKSTNGFEQSANHWMSDTSYLTNGNSFEGKHAFLLPANAFLPEFSISLDSVANSSIQIVANCWFKKLSFKNPSLKFYISINSKDGNILWESINPHDQMIDNKWNYISNSLKYENRIRERKLIIGIWNTSSVPVCVDEIEVKILTK